MMRRGNLSRPLGALALLLAACGPAEDGRSLPASRPNVILISIDTLRADHLSAYGYHRQTSPFIDRFARQATVFRHAIAPAPWTLPAHASIFLAQYPHVHGIATAERRIEPQASTLTELLTQHGYRTAGFFTVGLLSEKYGFDQGFETYLRVKPGTAEAVNRSALEWLQQRPEPFFLFLHYFDVHGPYDRKRLGTASYCRSEKEGELSPFDRIVEQVSVRFLQSMGLEEPGLRMRGGARQLYRDALELLAEQGESPAVERDLRASMHLDTAALTAAERVCLIGLYDDGVRYLDGQLERLFDELTAMRLLDDALVVVTADHGENLYAHHHYRRHQKYLYQSIVHVPLIVKLPGQREGRVVEHQVSTVDVSPTILEAVGVPPPDDIQGQGLVSAHGRRGRVVRTLLSEGEDDETVRKAILRWPWKLIVSPDGGELFHLARDPGEGLNLLTERGDVARQLAAELERLATAPPTGEWQEHELDEATLEELRTLGYID